MKMESLSLFNSFASLALSIASAICTPTTAMGCSDDVENETPSLIINNIFEIYFFRELYCSVKRW